MKKTLIVLTMIIAVFMTGCGEVTIEDALHKEMSNGDNAGLYIEKGKVNGHMVYEDNTGSISSSEIYAVDNMLYLTVDYTKDKNMDFNTTSIFDETQMKNLSAMMLSRFITNYNLKDGDIQYTVKAMENKKPRIKTVNVDYIECKRISKEYLDEDATQEKR